MDSTCPWKTPQDLVQLQLPSFAETETLPVLTPEKQKEDLACLKQIFLHQYAATEYYSDRELFLIQRIDERIQQIKQSVDMHAFYESLPDIHKGMSDVHLGYSYIHGVQKHFKGLSQKQIFYTEPLYKEKTSETYHTLHSSQQIRDCLNFQLFPSLDQENTYRFVGTVVSDKEMDMQTVTCNTLAGSKVILPVTRLQSEDELSQDFSFESLGPDVLYIRLPRTFMENQAEQARLFERLKAEDFKQGIIFDLRQNPGGPGALVQSLSKLLRAGSDTKRSMELKEKDSIYSLASKINILNPIWFLSKQSRKAKLYQAKYQQLNQNLKNIANKDIPLNFMRVKTRNYSSQFGERAHPFPYPIVFIVDQYCASNCEKLLFEFHQLPNVYRLGSHTAGAIHFGELGVMQLPHSKVFVYSGLKYFVQPLDIEEGVGYPPDYYVIERDPVTVAQEFIQSKLTQLNSKTHE